VAFTLKESLLVIDDFKPGGSRFDIQRAHREADRYLRAQRNRSGRTRMRADGTLRLGRPPRGLTISTGEETPWGQSLRAGLVILELKPPPGAGVNGDVDFDIPEEGHRGKLTLAQEAAKAGVYAQLTAAFLRWFAPRYESFRVDLEVEKLMETIASGAAHRRTPRNLAHLAVGLKLFLEFAEERGAIDGRLSEERWQDWLQALREVAQCQGGLQDDDNPAMRFLSLIRSAVSSGRAHVATPEGREPALEGSYTPETWGWRRVKGGPLAQDELRPQGERIGWVELENLYLEPDSSFTVAQKLGSDQGKPLEITAHTLGARLRDQGLLKSRDSTRETTRVRVTVEGRRTPCFHFHVDALLLAGGSLSHGDQPAQPDQEAKNDARADEDLTTGQVGGQELRPRLASGSDAGNESYDEVVRWVRKKDGDGDSQGARPGDGAELVRQRLLDLTRKPDPSDQEALPMEEGWL
jgi:hypothetical protein